MHIDQSERDPEKRQRGFRKRPCFPARSGLCAENESGRTLVQPPREIVGPRKKPKIVRPQYEAGAIYEDFVFFFGAFFFFVAMVLFLDA